ncbi:hypothetical protein AM2010_1287 [Pelagerythrobacter marensis]|uniref:Uncharacterized protein n=1 Tax=Pelagerythrobacter marensis TaxID=543877 RepID=A0A0G3X731_9SPHN|nr:hypothetical protein AM2010_1287 [Pelagerythrobacter marensis]
MGPVRGLLTVAGRSAAAFQIDLALRLGCERIVCFAEGLDEGVLPLLHQAEQAGASFHALGSARALSGLVKAQDDLFVFAEGVVPDPLVAGELLAERPGIVALPAEPGLEAGFERIDRDHAWAGLARLPGSAVERLAEMPIDVDAVPALLRVGLQSGTRIVPLPRLSLTERRWTLLRDEQDARSFETTWLNQRIVPASFMAPAYALADRISLTFAPQFLARRGRALLPLCGGALGLGGALVAAHWQMAATAFGLLAIGAFLLRMSLTLGSLLREEPAEKRQGRLFHALPGLAVDAAILGVMALVAPPAALVGWMFAGVVCLLALRVAEQARAGVLANIASDRAAFALVLVPCAAFDQLLLAIQIFALIFLLIPAINRNVTTDNADLTMSG